MHGYTDQFLPNYLIQNLFDETEMTFFYVRG